jgi:hypothetical protein
VSRYRCVDAQKAAGFPVATACTAAAVSTSAYYAWAIRARQGPSGRHQQAGRAGWVVTHSVGPGAPGFVCLPVRLRSDFVRLSFGDRSGALPGLLATVDPAATSTTGGVGSAAVKTS